MKALISRVFVGMVCSTLLIPALAWAEEAGAAKSTAPAAVKEKTDDELLMERMVREAQIREQANQQMARQYLESGKKRFEERRYEEAEASFEQALKANPNLAEAKEMLLKTRRVLGKTESGGTDETTGINNTITVREQYQYAAMVQQISDSQALIAAKNYSEALVKLKEAENSARALAVRYDVRQQLAEIKTLTAQATAAQTAAMKADEQGRLAAAKKMAEAEQVRLSDLQKSRVERMMADAKRFRDDKRYELAQKKYEEVLKIEPRNTEAALGRDDAYEQAIVEHHIVYTKALAVETQRNWDNLLEQRVPYPNPDPIYPANWEELKAKAAAVAAAQAEEDPEWLKQLKGKLEEKTRFDFIATPLEDVVAYLRQQHNVNIVLDRQTIQASGTSTDVTLKMDNVKLKTGLDQILRMLGLSYTLENESIYISTKEKIDQSRTTVTRFYDVTDLTLEIRNFTSNTAAISQSQDYSTTNTTDIFAPTGADTGNTKPETFTGDTLMEFIKTVIAPGTWTELDQPLGR